MSETDKDDLARPARGVVDEVLQARELLAAEYELAGFLGAADDARSDKPSPHCAVTLRAIRAALTAALPAALEDYVLAPREPTEAMLDAGYLHTALVDLPRDIYAAMLAAAPAQELIRTHKGQPHDP